MELDVQLCSLQIYFWGNAVILTVWLWAIWISRSRILFVQDAKL